MSLKQGCKVFFAAKKILHCNSGHAMKIHDERQALEAQIDGYDELTGGSTRAEKRLYTM